MNNIAPASDFFQRWRDKVNPYLSQASSDTVTDAAARLDRKYIDEAKVALDGVSHPAHNHMTLSFAFAYADLGLSVVDAHALRTNAVPTDGKGGNAKFPLGAGWQKRATTDRAELTAFWRGEGEYPENSDGEVFPFKPSDQHRNLCITFPEGCGLFVVDVDGEKGRAALEGLEEQFGPLPETWESLSGSGDGFHMIFKGAGIRNTASAIAPGIDIRGEGGQICAPPSIHKSGGFYRWADGCAPWERPIAEAPDWLWKLAHDASKKNQNVKTKPKKSGKSKRRADARKGQLRGVEEFLALVGDGEGQDGFNNPLWRAACSFWATEGCDADSDALLEMMQAAVEKAERDPKRDRSKYDTETYLTEQIEKARDFVEGNPTASAVGTPHPSMDISDPLGETMSDSLATLDQRWALVNHGGKLVCVRRPDPERERDEALENMTPSTFRKFHEDRQVFVEVASEGGTVWEKRDPAQEWLAKAKRHSRVTFAPPPLYAHANDYNLFDDFDLRPHGDPAVGCEKIKAFLLNVICDGREDVFNWLWLWLAHAVQLPGEKPGTALVIQGKGGSGKSTLGDLIGDMFGSFAIHASNPDHVTGRFNKHQATALMLISDEALYGGDPRISSIIKDMVTSPTQRIEPKGIDSFEVRSCLRCVFMGNPQKVVPIETNGSDRRFLCLTVSSEKMGNTDYFAELRAEAKTGGLTALYDELLAWNPASAGMSWNDVRTAPLTKERRIMRWLSLRPSVRAMAEIVEEGDLVAREETGRVVRYTLNEDAPTPIEKSAVRAALKCASDRRDSRDSAEQVFGELFGEGIVDSTKRQVRFQVVERDDGYHLPGSGPEEIIKNRAQVFFFPPLSELRSLLQERFHRHS